MLVFSSAALLAVVAALAAGGLLTVAPHLGRRAVMRLSLSELQSTGLQAAFHVALLFLLPLAGFLIDAWGPRTLLSTGSLLAATAVALLTVSRGFGGAMVGILLLGNATACTWTASVILMPAGFGSGHPVAAINLGFVVLGLGLLLGTWLPEMFAARIDERRGLGMLALLALLPALLAAVTSEPARPPVAAPAAELLRQPAFWLVAAALFFCLPVELALTKWVERYLTEVGHVEWRLAWLRGGFGLAFLLGRLAAAATWERGWLGPGAGPWLVLVLALIAAMVLGNLAGASGRRGPILALLCMGAMVGPLTPTLLGLLLERTPQAHWGTAVGGTLPLGLAGPHLLLPLLSVYTRRVAARHVLWLHMVGLLLVGLLMLTLALVRFPAA